jgi:O-antigen ligase
VSFVRRTEDRRSPAAIALAMALTLAAVVGAWLTPAALFVGAIAALLPIGYLAWRHPHAMLVVVVLAPLLDRFVVALLIPSELQPATAFASEALLAVVGACTLLRGLRDGHASAALRHPAIIGLGAFVVLGILSAVVNGVPPSVAGAGLVFTLDAAVMFVLPRLVPFDARSAARAVDAFVAVAAAAALLAMGQVLLHPNFLGLESFNGRFAEGQRIASIFVSPNLLGVVLAMALPFPAHRLAVARGRQRLAPGVLTLLLVLALLYSFSRGAWLALAVAVVAMGLLVERRVIVALLVVGAIAFVLALVLPRHVLYADRDAEQFDVFAATFGRVEALGEGDLRVAFVANAAPIIRDHPLVGAGPGRYGGAVARSFGSPLYAEYTEGTPPIGRTVDNFWLHLLVEAGVLGTVAFAGAVAAAALDGVRRARAAPDPEIRLLVAAAVTAALVLAVDGITEMVLEGNTVSFAGWFFLGLATSLIGSGSAAAMAQKASR